MGGLLSPPAPQQFAPSSPAPPSRNSAEVQAAALNQRRRQRSLVGRASTIKTSDEGVSGDAEVRRASLLGGASQATGA